MVFQEFQMIFKKECEQNEIIFSEAYAKKLFQYMNLILEWNEKVNLTAVREEKAFIMKHLIDSLTVNLYMKDAKKMLDIGTGAGLPGIPLKIYNPSIEATLIDSVGKKVKVLEDVIDKMQINKIEVLHVRAEDLAQNVLYREKFDIVTTRAVSGLPTIVEYMLPFVKIGGKAVCMKGPNIEQEIDDAKKAIQVLGGEVEQVKNFCISDELERNLIIIKKIKKTDKKYPRGQGKPLKSPIV